MEGGVVNRALRSTKGTHQKVGAWKNYGGGVILGCHITKLIEAGADVNVTNRLGNTALMKNFAHFRSPILFTDTLLQA